MNWVHPVFRGFYPIFWGEEQMKIASFLAMTTILIAQGRNPAIRNDILDFCVRELVNYR